MTHGAHLFADLIILVAFAIAAVAICERIRVPSVVGFLLTGIVIGPFGFGAIGDQAAVTDLAEIGVVLLLFEIGLEFSLTYVIRMRTIVLVGGVTQVVGTIAVVTGVGLALGGSLSVSLAFGGLLALSSTAIVLKSFRDRGELDTPHGRVALGILLFQDLAIVPLMLLMPLLAATSATGLSQALLRLVLAVTVVAVLLGGGRYAVPWFLDQVVGFRNRELFTLSVAFIGLGAAFVTASVGLSLALGAFLAGLLISESEYGFQALSDVLPFRALFSGIFFISIGMLLNLPLLLEDALVLSGLAGAILLGKAALITGVVLLFLKRPWYTSMLSGLGLAQVGEFSFVLAGVAVTVGVLNQEMFQVFLGASVLSMLLAPFVIAASRPIAEQVSSRLRLRSVDFDGSGSAPREKPRDHAIIVGYGLSGRHLARVLKAAELPYVVLEMNGQVVRRASESGEPVYFGDGTRREILESAGIAQARVVVFSIASAGDEKRGVAVAREMNPDTRIVVRTRFVASITGLEELGADVVVVEEFEAALELFEHVLGFYNIPSNTIQQELSTIRLEQYGVLRGKSDADLRLSQLRHWGIHNALELVEVEEGSRAEGENPSSLRLRQETGSVVVAVIREGCAFYTPDPDFGFRAGDTVVLVGEPDSLVQGAKVFRAGATAAISAGDVPSE